MERLSKRCIEAIGGYIYAKCENCTDKLDSCYEEGCNVPRGALTKLAAYENTGLEPWQVRELMKTEKEAAEAWNKRNTVYCKDCRFRKDNWLCSLLVDKPDTFIVTPDFYCAYREKKK